MYRILGSSMSDISSDIFSILKEADSIIIDSDAKVGKMTFVSYLVKLLFDEKALFFSSQEAYLLNKKIDALSRQYAQFEDINTYFNRYLLKDDWENAKRCYGYSFLLIELERIISSSEEKIIVFHRLGDFFEFQDRYEIEGFYKSLVKIVTKYDKKIIFLINNQNQNYKYIQNVADEFSDVALSMSKNEKNERIIDVKNILTHEEYPPIQLRLHNKNFILQYKESVDSTLKARSKNILIMQLDNNLNELHDNMIKIYDYIFNRPGFHVYHANSFQSILNHIFIKPDVIIILMNRTQDNFETIRAIKIQLPETMIISVIEQDFVRSEDMQEAYKYGCDELLAKTYLFDRFILSLQKSLKLPFYSETLDVIKDEKNILTSLSEFKEVLAKCIENAIFFTCFVIEKNNHFEHLKSTMRRLDFIYQSDDKIYYLALNTMSWSVDIIIEKQMNKFNEKINLLAMYTALDTEALEDLS